MKTITIDGIEYELKLKAKQEEPKVFGITTSDSIKLKEGDFVYVVNNDFSLIKTNVATTMNYPYNAKFYAIEDSAQNYINKNKTLKWYARQYFDSQKDIRVSIKEKYEDFPFEVQVGLITFICKDLDMTLYQAFLIYFQFNDNHVTKSYNRLMEILGEDFAVDFLINSQF
ncbi:MAG: hypothetical protein HC892_14445 [Saprospiraceae bacterium]|nr:hypothetical protein [Saprospiraceae bacterium]